MIVAWGAVVVLSLVGALEPNRSRRPVLSVRFPGLSTTARLEVPSVEKLRSLSQAIRRDLGGVDGGVVAIARRTVEAQRVIVDVSLSALFADEDSEAREARTTEQRAARYARRLFERLGATYVKLGQLIASSPTLFPRAFVDELERCLDRAPPVAVEVVERTISDAFGGRPVSELFATFDPAPLATASVAQVHAATLFDGTRVVVKVRKPDVEASLKCDLAFVAIAAKALEAVAPDLGRVNLAAIIEDLRASIVGELDFGVEAARLDQFAAFLRENRLDATCATCPRPIPDLCRETVLTMTRLDGAPLINAEKSPEAEEAVATMLRVWALSVVAAPFFHADVHGANVFLCDDGRVGFLDFGIVGKLDRSTYDSVIDMAEAYQARDYAKLAEALRAMGVAQDTLDMDRLAQDIRVIFQRATSKRNNDLAGLVRQIIDVADRNDLRLPREFGLLTKQVLYLDRYLSNLAPDLDVFADPRLALLSTTQPPPPPPPPPPPL